MTTTKYPIHSLLAQLLNDRLAAIIALAADPSSDNLRRVTELHLAVLAVREEIERHAVRLAHGDKIPLE